jgi:hypothetical protein
MDVLPVSPQVQPNEYWCWAAVASMVTGYYARLGRPSLSQCQVAQKTLNVADCSGSNAACLQLWDLCDALQKLGYSPQNDWTSDIGAVSNEIQQKRVLAALMYFTNSGVLHYVLVNGCDDASETVYVTDPAGPVGQVSWNTFLSNYNYHPDDPAIWKQWILIQT